MSTGSVKDREIGSKEDFVKKGSVTAAEKWCKECREILGLGVMGDARQMNKAINGIVADLADLKSLAPYSLQGDALGEKLDKFREDFKALAWDLEILRAEYRSLEQQKKNASFRSSEEKNAKKAMKVKAKEIQRRIDELETLNEAVSQVADDEKQRQKDVLDSIKSRPDGKEILATRKSFGKVLVKLRKLSEFFAKKYDTVTAEKIGNDFAKFAGLNWLVIDSAGAAAKELETLQNSFDGWVKLRELYVKSKADYKKAVGSAQTLMETAEKILPTGDLTNGTGKGFLDLFTAGEQAALAKKWDTAGGAINEGFVSRLTKRVNEVQSRFDIWQKIKEKAYPEIKSVLENLQNREYQIIGLQLIADAVAHGDQTRDYETAVGKFNTAEIEAKRIKAVDAHFIAKRDELSRAMSPVRIKADGFHGDAQKFAVGYPDKIAALRDTFNEKLVTQAFAKSKVPTVGEIDKLLSELLGELKTMDDTLNDLSDPLKLAALTEEMKKNRDIRPLLAELQQAASVASNAVLEYASLGLDPVNDPTKIADWRKTIAEVGSWVELREGDLKQKLVIDFDQAFTAAGVHKTALEQIVTDTSDAASGAQSAIDIARQELTVELNKLKKWMTGTRFTTIRQATWHSSAEGEIQQIEVLLKTDNKAILIEKKARVLELVAQCRNVVDRKLEDVLGSPELSILPEWKIQYENLKSRLSKLITALKKNDAKKVLPRECERYAGKTGVVVQAREELQNDGPGSMDKKFAAWEKRVESLETEVHREAIDKIKALSTAKKACEKKVTKLRERINGPLCAAIQEATKEVVLGNNLPLMTSVGETQGYLATATSVERFAQIEKQLDNLDQEITWAIEDVTNGDGKRFVDDHRKAEEGKRKSLEAISKFRARYNLAKEAYEKAKKSAKGKPGLDKSEYKRYVDLFKQAEGAAKKANWSDACKRMDLACRLMQMLDQNPLGSQVTGRGAEHLKELNVRWVAAIKTLNDSLATLGTAVSDSCTATAGVNSGVVVNKFNAKVVTPVKTDLDPAAFQRELLVLQGTPPSKEADRRKDLDNKKKYREQALAKVRSYQRLMKDHPMYKTVMYQSNPWRQPVNALDLQRAINDIDLNVQRSVG